VFGVGESARWQRLVSGVREGLGAGAVVAVVGLSFGASAQMAGWGVLAPVGFSILVFSGSAQFALLTGLSAGSAVAAVAAAALINGRYVVMSIAVNGSLSGSRFRRAVQTQALVDASFVIGSDGSGRFDIYRLVGASIPQYAGWVLGTLVGSIAAPSPALLYSLGGDVVFPAFFALLALAEARRSRNAAVVAGTAAALGAALLLLVDPATALLGTTAAALLALCLPQQGSQARSDPR
jgi:predicted branched-subunit amino acid permease